MVQENKLPFPTQRYMPKSNNVEAALYVGDTTRLMDIYKWVEKNTQGSYDVNDSMSARPVSGVSITATTGTMVIANSNGEYPVTIGDIVYRDHIGEFHVMPPKAFGLIYELVR